MARFGQPQQSRRSRPEVINYRGYKIERTGDGYSCDHVEDESLATVKRYIDGWVADANHEAACESMEAARFEERAYGYD